MPEEIPIEERATKRLRSAIQLLYALALLKLFGVVLASRVTGRDPSGAIAWYVGGLLITIGLAYALTRGLRWARNAVFVWCALHVAGIFFFPLLGVAAILEGMLGAMIGLTLLIASGLGAFEGR